MPKPLLVVVLISAVFCLLLGPVVLIFLPFGRTTLWAGVLMLLYGGAALWIGMKQLEEAREPEEE